MRLFVISLSFVGLFVFMPTYATIALYQEGDLIFHESKSPQSKAIQEATGSRWSHVGILFSDRNQWYVAEAVQPVRITPINDFKNRGKNGEYVIYRIPGLSDSEKIELRKQVGTYIGKSYDLYFEWSDDLIYCSELVYKSFFKAIGIEIGQVQKFKDLKLDGPYMRELIRRRSQDTGRTIDLEEPIVTPVSQTLDKKLELIDSH